MSDTELVETPATEPEVKTEPVEPIETDKENIEPAESETPEANQDTNEEPDELSKYKYATQKRIDKLISSRSELERKYQEAVQKLQTFEQAPKSDEPLPDQFDTQEDYLIAKGKWEAKREFEANQKAQAEAEAKKAYEAKIAERAKEFQAKEAEFRKETPDYDEASQVLNEYIADVNPNSTGFQVFRDVMISSDVLPQLTYELGKNPDLVESLMKMPPLDLARTLFYKEYEIKNAPKKATTKPVAAPPNPIKGAGTIRSDDELSGKELLKKYSVK